MCACICEVTCTVQPFSKDHFRVGNMVFVACSHFTKVVSDRFNCTVIPVSETTCLGELYSFFISVVWIEKFECLCWCLQLQLSGLVLLLGSGPAERRHLLHLGGHAQVDTGRRSEYHHKFSMLFSYVAVLELCKIWKNDGGFLARHMVYGWNSFRMLDTMVHYIDVRHDVFCMYISI